MGIASLPSLDLSNNKNSQNLTPEMIALGRHLKEMGYESFHAYKVILAALNKYVDENPDSELLTIGSLESSIIQLKNDIKDLRLADKLTAYSLIGRLRVRFEKGDSEAYYHLWKLTRL